MVFIKPYKFLIKEKGERFVYICTQHQVKKNCNLTIKKEGRVVGHLGVLR